MVSKQLRYKIEKKVKEHKRKVKKNAKKNPIKRKRKDPGIPNSLPFKHSVLKEAEDFKVQLKAEKEQRRKMERDAAFNNSRSLEEIMKDVEKDGDIFLRKTGGLQHVYDALKEAKPKAKKPIENSLKTFYKEFKKVIDQADVILEVLDARDPLGTRCKEVEDTVISAGINKKLVLVLNKIDLIPRENAEAWLKYLKNEFPVIPFKTSLQKQKSNLSQSKNVPMWKGLEKKTSNCLGANIMMKLLGNYCRNQGIKTVIRVGVVGLPNTGKSSIINSLKRSRVCAVGATPGLTRSLQEVSLSQSIKLLDSPGVVMSANPSDTSLILKNCVNVPNLADPTIPVAAILRRCNKDELMLRYNLPKFKNASEFLAMLAHKWGFLKKGGAPIAAKAAKVILQHWNSGKISYFTHPPELVSTHISAEIVSEIGKAFDLDSLLEDETKILKTLKPCNPTHLGIEPSSPVSCLMDEDSDNQLVSGADVEAMNDENETEDDNKKELGNVTISLGDSKSNSTASLSTSTAGKSDKVQIEQLNKERKEQYKKMKKKKKKANVLAEELADDVIISMNMNKDSDEEKNSGSDYDVDAYFN